MITSTQEPQQEFGQDPILDLPITSIFPSEENEKLYNPVDPKDPEVQALAKSILKHGIRERLVITEDGWILSGHRRYVAARIARLDLIPCRVEPFRKDDDHDQFMVLLREYNRQRVKTFSEKVREEIISVDPDQAYESLIEHRREQSEVIADTMVIRGEKRRAAISKAKEPFLHVVQDIIEHLRPYWPLSDRRIHYKLLKSPHPPLIHASKPQSTYRNKESATGHWSTCSLAPGLRGRFQ